MQCEEQLAVSECASPSNQEPRLLHRLLRGELDEADIHRAAEQAAAAAAASDQQQQMEQGDEAPDACPQGCSQQKRDDVRLFAELASYCNATSIDDHDSTAVDGDVDDIIVSHFHLFELIKSLYCSMIYM